jgi:type 1 fimbria pilin
MRLMRVVALLLTLLGLGTSLWSQTGTSTVRGTVTDPSGRVVADAKVTLTNLATNAVRTTKTSDAGT